MTNLPKVSIVVCTYNGEKHLPELLRSLDEQSYTNIEVVVVDDDSKDGTWELLQNWSAGRAHIRLVRQEKNVGFIKNFESGIALSTGTYVALCDQDDIWKPNKITDLIEIALAGSHLMVYHNSELIDAKGVSMQRYTMDQFHPVNGAAWKGYLYHNNVSGHAMLIHRSVFEKALPLPVTLFHDRWLAFSAALMGTIQYLPEALVAYRQHEQAVTDFSRSGVVKEKKDQILAESNLHWEYFLRIAQDHPEAKVFIEKLLGFHQRKKPGTFSWGLFFFLLANRNDLFSIPKKSAFSILNRIRLLSSE